MKYLLESMRALSLCLIFAFMLPSVVVAAPSIGSVRMVVGDVTRINEKVKNWKKLVIGNKVTQKDEIKTALESDITIGFPDGSMVTIAENAHIALSEFFEEDGSFVSAVDVLQGRLIFSAQKQGRNSEFRFKTGTMAVAVRGTEGCIDGGEFLIAGLSSGAIQIDAFSGEKALIRGGQVALKKDSLIVLDIKSAGDPEFHKRLARIVADSTIPRNDLVRRIYEADTNYQKMLKASSKKEVCVFDALPDTVYTQEILMHGRCHVGAKASFYREPLVIDENNRFLITVALDPAAVGEKRFKLTCSSMGVDFSCAEATTYYKPERTRIKNTYSLTSPIPAHVCDEGLVVEGNYQVEDSSASLHLVVGDMFRSSNLLKIYDGLNHPFRQSVVLSDRNGLWGLRHALLEFEVGGRKETREIPLRVDRTCQSVNQNAPSVQMVSYDSLACSAYIAIGNSQDDLGVFRTNVDNIDGKPIILDRNMSMKIPLKSGIHNYDFTAEDQAGNLTILSKTLGCFPSKPFSIKVEGGNKDETVWSPPGLPVGGVWSAPIAKILRFSIDLNDVSEVYSVIVKHNGKVILQEKLGQITSLDYDVPVELVRNKRNKLDIIVRHKSGFVATATKVYGVK